MTTQRSFLRSVALTEGVSFLVLLGIAMPLKYLAGMPAAVKLVGWTHGVLFMLLVGALAHAVRTRGWTVSRAGIVFVSALLPFGPFVVDRRMHGFDE
jgi:integral membrane protein